jgi:phosphate acetyltransferase
LEIIDAPDSRAAAARAVALIREGRAEVLMKGSLHTDELMSAIVSRRRRSAHGTPHQPCVPDGMCRHNHKVLIVTDAAINIAPALEDKVDICPERN